MKNTINTSSKGLAIALIGAIALLFSGSVIAADAEPLIEGKHYIKVTDTDASATPEVIEFFSYGCPHCFGMEQFVKTWDKEKSSEIRFVRVPVAIFPQWEIYSKAYYVAEALGVLEKTHEPLFHQVHNLKKPLSNEADLKTFFRQFELTDEQVDSALSSFVVDSRMRNGMQMARKYKITGVPAFVINEKYRVTGSDAGSYQMLDRILKEVPLSTVGTGAAAAAN